jgi:hypothetical protein
MFFPRYTPSSLQQKRTFFEDFFCDCPVIFVRDINTGAKKKKKYFIKN